MAPLIDNHGRRLDYLRLSVTDRCNLRCRYCTPDGTVHASHKPELLTWEEMLILCRIFATLGVRKIRLTGGEPLVRRGVLDFLWHLRRLPDPIELALTTNGSLLEPRLERLRQIGLRRLNISLDTLRLDTFRRITRSDGLAGVRRAIERAADLGFILKINMVVMAGINDREIEDFAELTRDRDWIVRFIETMPFDGAGGRQAALVRGEEILARLRRTYQLRPVVHDRRAVDDLYQVPGYAGRIGIISGHSRTFCAACSRLRVSARGQLRTCLYGPPVLDLRSDLRRRRSEAAIRDRIRDAVEQRFADGLAAQEAQGHPCYGGMFRIGG